MAKLAGEVPVRVGRTHLDGRPSITPAGFDVRVESTCMPSPVASPATPPVVIGACVGRVL